MNKYILYVLYAVFAAAELAAAGNSATADNILTLDGRVEYRTPFKNGPTFTVIVTTEQKVYTIWPPQVEQAIDKLQGLDVRLAVHLNSYTYGSFGGTVMTAFPTHAVDGTVTPLSWEVLDKSGAIIKNHKLRKPQWRTYFSDPFKQRIVVEGTVKLYSGYSHGPSHVVILTKDERRYTIWPREKEEVVRKLSGCLVRFTVYPCEDPYGYDFQLVDGTLTPLSWKILEEPRRPRGLKIQLLDEP